jgi:hypothetical protein
MAIAFDVSSQARPVSQSYWSAADHRVGSNWVERMPDGADI